jgi:hypothetical protein
MTPREIRKIVLEGLSSDELLDEYQKTFGEGTTWSQADRAIDAILDHEFSEQSKAHISLYCSRCRQETPHRTPAILRDDEGKKIQQMQCTVCETLTIVPTGERGEEFQQNVDEPDNTDFSGLDS